MWGTAAGKAPVREECEARAERKRAYGCCQAEEGETGEARGGSSVGLSARRHAPSREEAPVGRPRRRM